MIGNHKIFYAGYLTTNKSTCKVHDFLPLKGKVNNAFLSVFRVTLSNFVFEQ